MKKMNNKGFSLVELIVVVLIMAIIAVALAPQVMKWVENSRKSTDCNNYDSLVSAVNVALADEWVMKEVGKLGTSAGFVTAKDYTELTWDSQNGDTSITNGETGSGWRFDSFSEVAYSDISSWNKVTDSAAGSTTVLRDMINYKVTEILGQKWDETMKLKRTTNLPTDTSIGGVANGCYKIRITKKGTVVRIAEPGQPDSTTPYKDNLTNSQLQS